MTAFPADFAGRACALWPRSVSRNHLAAEIAVRLLGFAADLGGRRFLDEYRRRSLVLGREVAFLRNGVEEQAQAVTELFQEAGVREIEVRKDFNGLDRVVVGVRA